MRRPQSAADHRRNLIAGLKRLLADIRPVRLVPVSEATVAGNEGLTPNQKAADLMGPTPNTEDDQCQ